MVLTYFCWKKVTRKRADQQYDKTIDRHLFRPSTPFPAMNLRAVITRPLAFTRCAEEVYSITYSPDGTLLACGHAGGCVSLWDRKSGLELFTQHAHVEVAATVEFSQDGKWLARRRHFRH